MDTLTLGEQITHYKTESVHFGGAYELSNKVGFMGIVCSWLLE